MENNNNNNLNYNSEQMPYPQQMPQTSNEYYVQHHSTALYKKQDKLATISLACGGLSIVYNPFAPILSLVAIILGIRAMKLDPRAGGKGFGGFICGIVGMVMFGVLLPLYLLAFVICFNV
jgi:hypothetical protein